MEFDKYSSSYFDCIRTGLGDMIVTDALGRILDTDESLELWIEKSHAVYLDKGFFFFCGNGASATMAEHLSYDCFNKAGFITETVSEISQLTAVGNDRSFEEVFSYRISKLLGEGDMLITISSSGNSPNILKAQATARDLGAFIVTLSGKKKNNMSSKSGDLNFYVPLQTYGLVESAHAALLHCWLDMYLDKYKGGHN